MTALVLYPTVLVRPEDALQLSEFNQEESEKRNRFIAFAKEDEGIKNRFVPLYDEMVQSGIFGWFSN